MKTTIPYSAVKDVPLGWFVAIDRDFEVWVYSIQPRPGSMRWVTNRFEELHKRIYCRSGVVNSWNKHLWQRTANNGNAKDFERVKI